MARLQLIVLCATGLRSAVASCSTSAVKRTVCTVLVVLGAAASTLVFSAMRCRSCRLWRGLLPSRLRPFSSCAQGAARGGRADQRILSPSSLTLRCTVSAAALSLRSRNVSTLFSCCPVATLNACRVSSASSWSVTDMFSMLPVCAVFVGGVSRSTNTLGFSGEATSNSLNLSLKEFAETASGLRGSAVRARALRVGRRWLFVRLVERRHLARG